MPPKVDMIMCKGHGVCYDVCPADPKVFELRDGKSHVVNPEECLECGACEANCPESAISLE